MKLMEAESVQDEVLHNFATLNLESIFFLFKKRNVGISRNKIICQEIGQVFSGLMEIRTKKYQNGKAKYHMHSAHYHC